MILWQVGISLTRPNLNTRPFADSNRDRHRFGGRKQADLRISIRRLTLAAHPIPRPEELRFETEERETETFVRATGRITSSTAATFESTLRDIVSHKQRVVLDMTNVDYIDSSGLGSLVAVYMHASRTKCELELANPKTRIKDLFSRSGLASMFSKVQEAGARHDELFGMTPS